MKDSVVLEEVHCPQCYRAIDMNGVNMQLINGIIISTLHCQDCNHFFQYNVFVNWKAPKPRKSLDE